MAAGSVVVTEERLANVHKITFAWTAGTGGDAGTATQATTYTYNGILLRAVTLPGAVTPSNLYDITITDGDGVDVANGLLADRSDTTIQWVTSGMGVVVGDVLTFNLAAAGSAKTGTCILYIGITPETTDALTAVQAQLGQLGAHVASKSITYDGSLSYAAFTVTGLVAVKVVGYVGTALTNHANATSVGTATSAAGLIAATAGTAMQTEGQAWVDNAPSKFETFPANWTLIGNGEDIAVVGTANITGGVVTLYCWYIPISAGAAVVAA